MQATLILIVATALLMVLGYYILLGIIQLLKQLVEHSRGALKSIFVIMGVVLVVWIIANREQSGKIIQHVQTWVADVESVDLFDLNLE